MSDFVDIFSFYEFEDSKGNKHQFPYSYERYGHFPFLPSEADKYIKYLEDYRDHCKDEEILAYNEKGLENSNNYYQDFKYSSESKKKTDEEIVNDYFNFDDFDNEEYNCALQNLKEYARNEVYDVNILLKEGLNDVSLAKDEVFAIVFFKDGAVSKVAYSSDILSYIGSHKQYGNEVYIRRIPKKYVSDLIFEMKFIYGLLLKEDVRSVNIPHTKAYKFATLKNAKKAYKLKYGISNKSKYWENVDVFARIKNGDKYQEIIVKPDLDRDIKNTLENRK